MSKQETATGTTLQLKRLLPARRERVFRAWTDPQEMAQWFSPTDEHQVQMLEQEAREGGRYRLEIRAPDGTLHVIVGTYRVVQPPEKLVFTWFFEKGGAGDKETLVTVELQERGESTELVLTHERFEDREVRDKHQEGWKGCLDRLERQARQA